MTDQAANAGTFKKRGIDFKNLDWVVVIGIGFMHIAALLAFMPEYFTISGLLVFLFMSWLTGGVGITLCYHRLLTHRSFKTPKWFEYILTMCGCLAWQGGPVQWVGVHRIHHKFSDEEEDPHSPKHGFSWGHMLWCMHKEGENRMKGVDAAKDLLRDPVLRFLNTWFPLVQFALIPVIFYGGYLFEGTFNGGMSWVVWGVFVRIVFVYHGTWFVNSAAHTWGYRNFETNEHSTNLWWVALMSYGEGWHNNHHAFQRSAAHGLRWFEIDITYMLIRILGLVGLARDIVVPDEEQITKLAQKLASESKAAQPVSNSHDEPLGVDPTATPQA